MDQADQKLIRKALTLIQRKDSSGIAKLLGEGLDVNLEIRGRRPPLPLTFLAHACEQKSIRIAKTLIKCGANVDKGSQYPPLFAAVRVESRELTRLLLDAGANPNIKVPFNADPAPSRQTDSDTGWTPLMTAVVSRDPQLVDLLLEAGADPSQTTKLGFSALDLAVRQKKTALIHKLTKAGARVSGQLLFQPISKGDVNTVTYLIQAGADVDAGAEGVSALVKGETPLEAAIAARWSLGELDAHWEKRFFAIIRALLDAGAKVNHTTQWRSPLYIAADHGDKELVQLLLKKGADPKRAITKVPIENGRSALHVAACGGHTDIIKLLLSAGADPNQRDKVGQTALETVRQQQRSSSIEIQEAVTAVVDSKKNRQKLESMYAEWKEQRAAIIRLLERAERKE